MGGEWDTPKEPGARGAADIIPLAQNTNRRGAAAPFEPPLPTPLADPSRHPLDIVTVSKGCGYTKGAWLIKRGHVPPQKFWYAEPPSLPWSPPPPISKYLPKPMWSH